MALEPLSQPPVPVAPTSGVLGPWANDMVRSLRVGLDKIVRRVNQCLTNANGTVEFADVSIVVGTGDPEGVVTANVGSLFLRTDGASLTSLYVKEVGTGPTGWTAK